MKMKDKGFLSKNMSIDTNWLENEIDSLSHNFAIPKSDIELFISNLICATQGKDAEKQILEYFELTTSSLNGEEKTYEIFDSLRHAFTSYVSGGLFDLYVYQSNESWYPKIVLKSELEPNDISALPDLIDIYRGCNISEFNKNKFGQSWSTSFKIAKEFAYQHYTSQEWYEKEKRCVLKATIKREDVFFSRQSNHEKEVAVNTGRLINIEKA